MKRCLLSTILAGVAALLLAAPAVPASGQSLGDLARKEEARRKTIKKPAPVYTNGSLSPAPGEVIPTPPGPPGSAPGAPAEAGSADAAKKAGGAEAPPDPKQTPEFWRKRIGEARKQRDANAVAMAELQTQINTLWAEFTARDDPAQRAIIGDNRLKALDELARRKAQQSELDQVILDIEEEARRAGVPPGWVR